MRIRHIVWDWNGTLFDDQPLVTNSTNASLAAVGFPSLGGELYQDLYRRPLQDFYLAMVGRAFSAEEWELVEAAFSQTYSAGMYGCGLTADAITALDSWAPRSQSLLSMYDHDKLIPLVDSFGLAARLARVDGRPPALDYGPKTKYLAVHLTHLQSAYDGLEPAEVALVGDCVDDAMAALEVGATAVLYTGGSSSRRNLEAAGLGVPVVDSLIEAVELLRDDRSLSRGV
ncbi:HAD family hydrolase [Actinospica sp. MGRD01-02]|uniref:HAD family hydrolase n=1 Tax=Actinospica acidithermotolerans TaxID=2828514 RepID=A0A941E2E3_9ACTN|nr:HAD hydrolase-like protein [Actinospica acidithermotolerans]MBR7824885.1 HAD family hydrolase [Actinospica acidithermotolerans]